MKKILIKILRFFIPKKIWRKYKEKYMLRILEVKEIKKNPASIYNQVYHIKENTWEVMYVPEIFQVSQLNTISCFHGAQDILEVNNARVIEGSDIVIADEHVLWDKSDSQYFSMEIPKDSNLYKYDSMNVYLTPPKKNEYIKGKCISLLGAFDKLWAHFLIQYLPKLLYAEEAKILDDVTIIMPRYTDENIIEITETIIKRHMSCRIIIADGDVEYWCEKLMYIPSASKITNEQHYVMPFEPVIPKIAVDRIHDNIVAPIVEKIKNNPIRYDKLYLTRRNPSYRSTLNNDEIETYFREKGFHFVTGESLSLEEKADLFYHAKIVAGAYSAAWLNTMFCNGAKGLMFSNIQRSIDPSYLTIAKPDNIQILCCIGDGVDSYHQTDFYMPLERIDAAYKQLLNAR